MPDDKCNCDHDDSWAFLALVGVVILLFNSCTGDGESIIKQNDTNSCTAMDVAAGDVQCAVIRRTAVRSDPVCKSGDLEILDADIRRTDQETIAACDRGLKNCPAFSVDRE